MSDDGSHLPGSGDVRPGGEHSASPPPSPQATSHDTDTPPEPEGSARSWWPLCLVAGVIGCGCLLIVLLALGVIGGVSWSILSAPRAPEEPPDMMMDEPPGDSEFAPDDATAGRPGRVAAMAWAHNRRSDWGAAVDDYSEDWTWVRLVMGPPASDWTTWVELQWDASAGRYTLIDEGPLGQEGEWDEDVPEVYQPGEEVAKEAALGYVEQPDWVARVDSHSDDWRLVTVSVGPPYSEWVWVVTLQWNDRLDVYDLVSIDDVDYPGVG
jgi:hypothetical protein